MPGDLLSIYRPPSVIFPVCDTMNSSEGAAMSQDQEDVEKIKALYQAFGRGDIPFVLAALDPEIEWNEAENFLYADRGPYIGPQAVLDGVFMRLATEWNNFSAAPHEILGSAGTVVSFGRYRGTYRETGSPVDAQFVHVFRLRDGRIFKFQQYTDTAQFKDVVERRFSTGA